MFVTQNKCLDKTLFTDDSSVVRHLKPSEIHCHLPMNDSNCSDSFFTLLQGLPCGNITINLWLPSSMCLTDSSKCRVMFKQTTVHGVFMFVLPRVLPPWMTFYHSLCMHPSDYSELTPFFYTPGRTESELEEAYTKTQNDWESLPGSF